MTHLGDLISAYLDGELSGSERRDAEAHLAGCEHCRDELAAVDAARITVRGLTSIEPPSSALRPGSASRRVLRPRWAWAASLVMAGLLALGLAVGPGEPASPFDMGVLDDQHVARVVSDPGISTIRGSGDGP